MTGSLFIHEFGHGESVVVLLHGLGSSGRYWRPVAERMADGIRVLCPDLLGFGRSPRPRLAYSVVDHLGAITAALDRLRLGDQPVVLGGHSTGAILALELAAARPSQVRGLLLISLPAYRSADEARTRIAGLSPLARLALTQPRLGGLVHGLACAGRPAWRAVAPLLAPGIPADIARDLVLHDWASYRNTLQHVIVEHRVRDAAAGVAAAQLPVRLLHGASDREAPLDAARELAEQHGWPLSVVRDGTHALPLHAPARCAEALADLLTATGQAGGPPRPAPSHAWQVRPFTAR